MNWLRCRCRNQCDFSWILSGVPRKTWCKSSSEVRAGKESERSALLVTLCKRTFREKTIIFLRSKKLAHQLRIVFSLLGMKCEELHGDLSQEQVSLEFWSKYNFLTQGAATESFATVPRWRRRFFNGHGPCFSWFGHQGDRNRDQL